jgi:hypothetical protein
MGEVEGRDGTRNRQESRFAPVSIIWPNLTEGRGKLLCLLLHLDQQDVRLVSISILNRLGMPSWKVLKTWEEHRQKGEKKNSFQCT